MKRVCNNNKHRPEKTDIRDNKIYPNRRVLSKNYKKYKKNTKFNIRGVKNM